MLIAGVEMSDLDIGRFLWMRVDRIGEKVVRLAALEPLIVEDMQGESFKPCPDDLFICHMDSPPRAKPDKIKRHEPRR